MEEIFENDDAVGRLLREEGLLTTSPGFTDRVMLRVEEISLKADTGYKPLISRKIWIIIALTIAALILVCIFEVTSGNPVQLQYADKIKVMTDYLTGFHIPMHVNSGSLMLATLIMASVGLLLIMDIFLNNRFREILK